MLIFFLNLGAPRCTPKLNLPNLNLGVQVRVQRLAAPNLNVQVQVHLKQPEPKPNQTTTSLVVGLENSCGGLRSDSERLNMQNKRHRAPKYEHRDTRMSTENTEVC